MTDGRSVLPTARPPWSLPVGERLDRERAGLLVEIFRDEAARVGRTLRDST